MFKSGMFEIIASRIFLFWVFGFLSPQKNHWRSTILPQFWFYIPKGKSNMV